jgi:hypothetical protein
LEQRETNVALIPNGKMGITISKLCGALATDGTIYKQRKLWNGYPACSYYFELADGWLDNVNFVSKWVNDITNKKGSIKPHKGSFRFRIGNKNLVSYLHALGFPYGDKCRTVKIPEEINKNKEFQRAFISSALMFDGTVKLDGTIEFSTISKKLFDKMISILRDEDVSIRTYKRKMTRWSNNFKYIFYSKSFSYFLNILEGPKKIKLEIIRGNRIASIEELEGLFNVKTQSKAPVLRELYEKIKNSYPDAIPFNLLKVYIENKYNVKFHRNTISLYLNLLVRCKIVKRNENGWYIFDY